MNKCKHGKIYENLDYAGSQLSDKYYCMLCFDASIEQLAKEYEEECEKHRLKYIELREFERSFSI